MVSLTDLFSVKGLLDNLLQVTLRFRFLSVGGRGNLG